MPQTDVTRHVENFFLSLDPEGSFVTIAERVAELAQTNEAARDAMRDVVTWLRKPLLDEESRVLVRRLRGGRVDPLDPPEGWSTLIAAGYLRALAQLRAAVRPTSLDKILSRVDKLGEMIKTVEPTLGATLVETELRCARDPRFAKELEDAKRQVVELLPRLMTTTDRFHPVLDVGARPERFDRPGTQQAAESRQAANGRFECCIDCVPTDCAVVVVVIVIVIVVSTL